jgi:hypothetical protein
MFDILNKYRTHGHFFFKVTDSLEEVCNVPEKRDGVYLVYQLKDGRVDLVYAGASGTRDILIVKDSLFGLRQTIINGMGQQNGIRNQEWAVKMLAEGIDALDIYWYVTYSGSLKDHPAGVQSMVLFQYAQIYDEFPPWNEKTKWRRNPGRKGGAK